MGIPSPNPHSIFSGGNGSEEWIFGGEIGYKGWVWILGLEGGNVNMGF